MKCKQNSKVIASCGPELKIHEWPSGKNIFKLSPPNGGNNYFKCISWSISGRQLLAIPTGMQPIVIKKVEDSKEFVVDILEEAQFSESGIFSKSIEELVTLGTASGEIFVIDVFRNIIIKRYPTLPSTVIFLDYTPKDTYLAAGCKNGQIYLFNNAGDVCSTFVLPYSHSLSSMMFHPTRESYLAAASKEGVVVIWDIRTNIEKFSVQNHTKSITDIAISASEELLATVGLDRNVRVYDLHTKEMVFNKKFSSELLAVSFSQIGEEFAVGTSYGRVFFIDRKKSEYTKGSISAQKTDIRGLSFCNALTDEDNIKLQETLSKEILLDVELAETSETKTQVSGVSMLPEEISGLSRIPGGMDDGLLPNNNTNSTENWIEQLAENDGDKQVPSLELIDECKLEAIKRDIINKSKENLQRYMEEINSHFLKIRMGVSREFCRIEQNNNRRWQEFNVALLNLAGCEEVRRERENVMMCDGLTEATQDTALSKPDSMYAPAKTKVTSYSLQNEH